MPDTPERAQQELRLRMPLGIALIATTGMAAPEVGNLYAQALALCRNAEDMPQLFPVGTSTSGSSHFPTRRRDS